MQLTQDQIDKEVEEIIKSIKNTENKQKYIVEGYAELLYLRQFNAGKDFSWPIINRTIIERWSLSGLKRIKEGAWKELSAMAKG